MKFQWITNGIKNVKCYDEIIPEGYIKGFTLKSETKIKKLSIKEKKIEEKLQIKNLPLKERKLVKAQSISEKKTKNQVKKIIEDNKINTILVKINSYIRKGYELDDIFNLLKFNDEKLNTCLYNLITERILINQLLKMPKYLETITESLKDLYKKDRILQNERNVEDYFMKSYLIDL